MSLDSSMDKFENNYVTGELRDVTQLADTEKRKYVNQGYAELSTNDEELQSEGFSQCSCLIIQGESQTYLAHINQWDLSDEQYEQLSKLPPGDYAITFIIGSLSRVNSKTLCDITISNFVKRLESNGRIAKLNQDIVINTGDSHWWVSYNPSNRILKVLIRKTKIVHEYLLK